MEHLRIHKHYASFDEEMRNHVDNMFDLLVTYAKTYQITLNLDDRAEHVVEAISTLIVESDQTGKVG